MPKRIIVILVAVWIASLVAVAAVTAQVMPQPVAPKVLSGADIGFEVTAIDHTDGTAVGRIVIKVKDKWVTARLGGALTPRFTP
jgi:hypothetical protein